MGSRFLATCSLHLCNMSCHAPTCSFLVTYMSLLVEDVCPLETSIAAKLLIWFLWFSAYLLYGP